MAAEDFKEIFAKNLNHYMEKKHVRQIDLVKEFKVSKSTVSGWCNGIKIPRMDKIERLAEYFGITKADLIEDALPKNMTRVVPDSRDSYIAIPVVGRVAAGTACFAEHNITEYRHIRSDDLIRGGNYVFLRVTGDSMYPMLMENDLALVRHQATADSGSIAVALIDGEDGVIKRVVYGNNFIELHSINPMYPCRRFEGRDMERIQIFGVVKRIIREF